MNDEGLAQEGTQVSHAQQGGNDDQGLSADSFAPDSGNFGIAKCSFCDASLVLASTKSDLARRVLGSMGSRCCHNDHIELA